MLQTSQILNTVILSPRRKKFVAFRRCWASVGQVKFFACRSRRTDTIFNELNKTHDNSMRHVSHDCTLGQPMKLIISFRISAAAFDTWLHVSSLSLCGIRCLRLMIRQSDSNDCVRLPQGTHLCMRKSNFRLPLQVYVQAANWIWVSETNLFDNGSW